MRKAHLLLYLFPFFEISAFVTALILIEGYVLWSIFFLFLAAFFLNFTLHISVHYHVHFSYKSKLLNALVDTVYTVLLVLPFHLYKTQHYNHHRYNNMLGDFTSTWKKGTERPLRQNFFVYSFLWLFKQISFKDIKSQAMKDGDLKKNWIVKMRIEIVCVICVYVMLFWWNPLFILYYSSLFYVGWSMIAMHNYGQHLPLVYGETIAYSFYNKLYNTMFFNNGLHFEHHLEPNKDYWSLENANAKKNKFPHLVEGFFIDTDKIDE